MTARVLGLSRRVRELVRATRINSLAARVSDLWATRLDGNIGVIRLGRYSLDRVVGHGTHGVVFAGFDGLLERDVAIKVFRSASKSEVLREGRILAQLDHPNVVRVLDVGSTAGFVYLVTALVDGWTIRQRVRMGLDWREICGLFIQAGRGLAAAHRACVVHGDVKPGNILVGRDGRVYVVDFGMARMLGWRERGEPPPGGTPGYMAPERQAGADADAWSDQFSFCVALWETLCGDRPDSVASPASVPAQLKQVLLRGLSPRPRDRHATMEAMLDEFEQHVGASLRKGAS